MTVEEDSGTGHYSELFTVVRYRYYLSFATVSYLTFPSYMNAWDFSEPRKIFMQLRQMLLFLWEVAPGTPTLIETVNQIYLHKIF